MKGFSVSNPNNATYSVAAILSERCMVRGYDDQLEAWLIFRALSQDGNLSITDAIHILREFLLQPAGCLSDRTLRGILDKGADVFWQIAFVSRTRTGRKRYPVGTKCIRLFSQVSVLREFTDEHAVLGQHYVNEVVVRPLGELRGSRKERRAALTRIALERSSDTNRSAAQVAQTLGLSPQTIGAHKKIASVDELHNYKILREYHERQRDEAAKFSQVWTSTNEGPSAFVAINGNTARVVHRIANSYRSTALGLAYSVRRRLNRQLRTSVHCRARLRNDEVRRRLRELLGAGWLVPGRGYHAKAYDEGHGYVLWSTA